MSKLDLIRENLYLGDICGATDILKNGSSKISHVLTILHHTSISIFEEWQQVKLESKELKEVNVGDDNEFARESSLVSGKLLYSIERTGKDLEVTRMAVYAHDKNWENILDFFDLCLDFIDSGLKEKGVLVHCFAGQSRSASIIIAHLMKTEKLSLEDALASIRQKSHVTSNPGFLKQLELFEKMNFKVDRTSAIYKRFRLKCLGYLYSIDKKFDKLKMRADPGISNETNGTTYQCKKCRRVLLSQEQVLDHTKGEADLEFNAMFPNMNGDVQNKNPSGHETQQCTSIFVEPMSWMNGVEDGASEGKLLCPNDKCNARLGSFDWKGRYCSCGSKIVPAFQIQMSGIDMIIVKDVKKNKKKGVSKS